MNYRKLLLSLILSLTIGSAFMPLHAQVVQDRRFGVVCPWQGLNQIGIGSVRAGAGATSLGNWAEIHKGVDLFDWKKSDAELENSIIPQGLDPLVILGYTPDFLAAPSDNKQASVPRDFYQFHSFVQNAAKRYKGKVSYWEVWNEPDIDFLSGTVVDYVNLLKTAHYAARSADPDAKIVFGGLAGVNLPYLEAAYKLGAKNSFDVMAVHPYQWDPIFNDEWFTAQLISLRTLMNKYGDTGKPIWLTELGWSTEGEKITPEVQARLLVQSITTAISLEKIGVERTFWFAVKDWKDQSYGILDIDGKAKPAATAYTNLISQLAGREYQGSLDLGPGIRAHVFKGVDNKQIAVLWADTSTQAKITVASFHSLVDHLGAPVPMQGSGESVTIGMDPLFLSALFPDGAVKERRKLPEYKVAKLPVTPVPAGVWISPKPPATTSNVFLTRGKPIPTSWTIFNHTETMYPMIGVHRIMDNSLTDQLILQAQPRKAEPLTINIVANSNAKIGLHTFELRLTGLPGGSATFTYPIRVSKGPVVEFLANSFTERQYLVESDKSATSPSIRFGDRWVYKFPVETAGKYRLDAVFGSNNKGPWSIQFSQDGKTFALLAAGSGDRDERSGIMDLKAGVVYLQFGGKDAQLQSLVFQPE